MNPWVIAVRHGIPALLMVVAFAILLIEGGESGWEGFALFTGAALSIWVIGWLVRLGISGDKDRVSEDEARAYFDEHGQWPDEKGS